MPETGVYRFFYAQNAYNIAKSTGQKMLLPSSGVKCSVYSALVVASLKKVCYISSNKLGTVYYFAVINNLQLLFQNFERKGQIFGKK